MAKKKDISGGSLFESVPLPADMQVPAGKKQARLRDGEILTEGEEVTVNAGVDSKYYGRIFVIEKMTEYIGHCESGMMCIVYQKDKPEVRIQGSIGIGIDANWFKKIET